MTVNVSKGDRVGVMWGATATEIQFLGYGTYLGDEIPEALSMHSIENPKIQLDTGQIVWGYEVWWSDEEAMRRRVRDWENSGFTITMVDIDDCRKSGAKREEATA